MTEVRAYDLDLEVRRTATERIIAGIVVPYNVEQQITRSLTEVFLPGAFSAVTRAAHRVKLLTSHDASQLPIGRGQLLREESRGLYGEFYVGKSQRGDELLEAVSEGIVDQFSVGFVPLKDNRRSNGVVERVRAHLAEVSLVTFGAYGEKAVVEAVREASTTPNRDAAVALLEGLNRE
jgi:HK97 family phage prohead protease